AVWFSNRITQQSRSETLSCMNKVRTASNEYSHDSKPNKGWQEKFREQNTFEQRERVFIPYFESGKLCIISKGFSIKSLNIS
ncbi:hypothetical protein ACO4G9_002072, partial [Vibrio parahaemolyticus]